MWYFSSFSNGAVEKLLKLLLRFILVQWLTSSYNRRNSLKKNSCYRNSPQSAAPHKTTTRNDTAAASENYNGSGKEAQERSGGCRVSEGREITEATSTFDPEFESRKGCRGERGRCQSNTCTKTQDRSYQRGEASRERRSIDSERAREEREESCAQTKASCCQNTMEAFRTCRRSHVEHRSRVRWE